jgi:hypothetical protein
MEVIVCQTCTSTHVYVHMSSCLGHRHVRKSGSPPLAVLTKHTEEAIVGVRFAPVIPFLGMSGYLVSIIELKRYERVDNLREGRKMVNVGDRTTKVAN